MLSYFNMYDRSILINMFVTHLFIHFSSLFIAFNRPILSIQRQIISKKMGEAVQTRENNTECCPTPKSNTVVH